MPTPLPPEIKKPFRAPPPSLQKLHEMWVHRGHDQLTEKMEQFTKQSKSFSYTLLLGTVVAGFLTWTSVAFGFQDTPFHAFTVVIWVGSVYSIHRARTIH